MVVGGSSGTPAATTAATSNQQPANSNVEDSPHPSAEGFVHIQPPSPSYSPHTPPFSSHSKPRESLPTTLRQVFRVILLCCDSIVAPSAYYPVSTLRMLSPSFHQLREPYISILHVQVEYLPIPYILVCVFVVCARVCAFAENRLERASERTRASAFVFYIKSDEYERGRVMQIHRVLSIKYSMEGDHVLSPTPCTPRLRLFIATC